MAGGPGGEVALVYLMIAITIGAAVGHLLSRAAPWLPYTPTLLVIGVITSLLSRLGQDDWSPHVYQSLEMWEQIDGHMLLFIFLPPLLFADSMGLQWNLIRRCVGQCALLAGPGVVIGSVLNAAFAYYVLPYGWGFELCLSYGAVQAATDPVAVVALLKQLGAAPSLTMIISGESLLNDGTAIVMWTYFFGNVLGQQRNILTFLIRLVFGGIGIGAAFGIVTLYWMSLLSRKHDHSDITIQVALTVVAAYICFYVAEGICHVSGVLAVVTMGVLLAATVWPLVCSRATMENVWHTAEWLFNTVLFQLAGLIIGAYLIPIGNGDDDAAGSGSSSGSSGSSGHRLAELMAADANSTLNASLVDDTSSGGGGAASHLQGTDVFWALATYLVCSVVRAAVVLLHFPILRRLGYGMNLKDATVAAWGGLHGSVGLALALSMNKSLRAISREAEGEQILLHVAAVAVLTLTVNAPSMAPLLRGLRMTVTSQEAEAMYDELKARVSDYAWREYYRLLSHGGSACPESELWVRAVPHWISVMQTTADEHQHKPLPQSHAHHVGGAEGGSGGGHHSRYGHHSHLSRSTRHHHSSRYSSGRSTDDPRNSALPAEATREGPPPAVAAAASNGDTHGAFAGPPSDEAPHGSAPSAAGRGHRRGSRALSMAFDHEKMQDAVATMARDTLPRCSQRTTGTAPNDPASVEAGRARGGGGGGGGPNGARQAPFACADPHASGAGNDRVSLHPRSGMKPFKSYLHNTSKSHVAPAPTETRRARKTARPMQWIEDADGAARLRSVRKQFLLLVKSSYTNMLEDGVMPPRSTLAIDVIHSVDLAIDRIDDPLYDWLYLARHLRVPWHTLLVVRLSALVKRVSGMSERRRAATSELLGRRSSALMRLFWHIGPHAYGVHAIYKLTCFITAHEEAQEEMHWLFGERKASLHREEVQVVGESRIAVKRARAYLADLSKIAINGQRLGDVIDGVRARQLASLLIHKVTGFVEQMYEHGILSESDVHKLIHNFEHDTVHLQHHVAEVEASLANDDSGRGASGRSDAHAADASERALSESSKSSSSRHSRPRLQPKASQRAMVEALHALQEVQREHVASLDTLLKNNRRESERVEMDDPEASFASVVRTASRAARSHQSEAAGGGCAASGGVKGGGGASPAAATASKRHIAFNDDDAHLPVFAKEPSGEADDGDEDGQEQGSTATKRRGSILAGLGRSQKHAKAPSPSKRPAASYWALLRESFDADVRGRSGLMVALAREKERRRREKGRRCSIGSTKHILGATSKLGAKTIGAGGAVIGAVTPSVKSTPGAGMGGTRTLDLSYDGDKPRPKKALIVGASEAAGGGSSRAKTPVRDAALQPGAAASGTPAAGCGASQLPALAEDSVWVGAEQSGSFAGPLADEGSLQSAIRLSAGGDGGDDDENFGSEASCIRNASRGALVTPAPRQSRAVSGARPAIGAPAPAEQDLTERLSAPLRVLSTRVSKFFSGSADTAPEPSDRPQVTPASPEPLAPPPAPSPPPLPEGWRDAKHPDGRTYYFARGTKHTQWKRPTEPASVVLERKAAASRGAAATAQPQESATLSA